MSDLSSGVADMANLVSASIGRWDARLERELFDSDRPVVVAATIDAWSRAHLGAAVARGLFYRVSVGATAGVVLADRRRVVIKVNRPAFAGERLKFSLEVMGRLADAGFPAPVPLTDPAPLAAGVAFAESYLDAGDLGDTHEPALRFELARRLAEIVRLAAPLLDDQPAPTRWYDAGPEHYPWPIPHDLRFNFPTTRRGAQWIDDLGRLALERLRSIDLPVAAGHNDWRAEHVRFGGGRIVASFDWDNIAVCPEAELVGHTASLFTADWSVADRIQIPSHAEAHAFVTEYESARGRAFSGDELRAIDAAHLYACAYMARCEHSDAALGLAPGMTSLARDRLQERHVRPLLAGAW